MEKVLEACAQLPLVGSEATALREFVAETARKVFAATLSGILARRGETYSLEAVSSASRETPGKSVLVSHATSFASQAIEQNRLLSFRFAYQDAGSEHAGH